MVREVVSRIDWPCQVETFFREHNSGCRKNVSEGLSWFFENEEEGIVLEDDCLPDPTFFNFCEELLDRYRKDDRVAMISGNRFSPLSPGETSYIFSRYSHIWGWAAWRRTWLAYDSELRRWPNLRSTTWLRDCLDGDCDAEFYWRTKFDRTHAGMIDSWDYALFFSCLVDGSLTILPETALVANIGAGTGATHTSSLADSLLPEVRGVRFPLSHPPEPMRSKRNDDWTERNVFRTRRSPVRAWIHRWPWLHRLCASTKSRWLGR